MKIGSQQKRGLVHFWSLFRNSLETVFDMFSAFMGMSVSGDQLRLIQPFKSNVMNINHYISDCIKTCVMDLANIQIEPNRAQCVVTSGAM